MDELQTPQPTPEGKSNPPTSVGASTSLKQIRTFQGDVANALQDQKESLFSIRQTEQLKRGSGGMVVEAEAREGKPHEFFLLLVGSLFLIILGAGGAWFGYKEFVKKTAPPVITAPESRLIAVQEEVNINFASTTRESLITLINENSAGVGSNTLKHFVLRKGLLSSSPLASTAEFFQKIQSQAPGSLVRAFDPLFMAGTLGESRFLIIKLSSFENAFPGMLAWEENMARDIGDLFATASDLKSIGSEAVFKDVISRNKDVRVLSGVGTTTTPLLLYSFFDNKILIITDSLETLRVLVDRLTQELLSR